MLVPKVFFLYNTSMVYDVIDNFAGKEVAKMCATRGQGLVEYALIMVLVAMVVMALLYLFGGSVGNVFSNIMFSI